MRSQAFAVVLAGLAVMIGGECVRAASHAGDDVTGTVATPATLGPAELDPAFQQKLLERVRGRYERIHPLVTPASQPDKI